MMQEFSKQAVHGVVWNEAKTHVLLIKRRDIPVWTLPGGGLDPGETPEKATCREVLEETGCHVEIIRKVAEYLPVNKMTQLTHLFECKLLEGTPSSQEESLEAAFFDVDHLPKMPPPYASWIQDARMQLPDLLIKKIAGVNYWVLLKFLVLHPVLVTKYIINLIKKCRQ